MQSSPSYVANSSKAPLLAGRTRVLDLVLPTRDYPPNDVRLFGSMRIQGPHEIYVVKIHFPIQHLPQPVQGVARPSLKSRIAQDAPRRVLRAEAARRWCWLET